MSTNDKLSDSLAVRPEFAAGEQPDHNKLSQAFIHIYGALNKVEGAIGPARDDSNNLYQNNLNHITNLTRQIGPAHGPQPRIPPGSTVIATSTFTTDRKSWRCPVWPFDTNGGPHIVFSGTFTDTSGANVFATEVSWLDPTVSMTATGQWIYDYRDNNVYSFSKLATSNGTVTFTSVEGIDSYSSYYLQFADFNLPHQFGNARQNVIPHPSITPATSVVITESAAGSTGSYLVTINAEVNNQDYHNLDFVNGDISANGLIISQNRYIEEAGAIPFFYSTNNIAQELPPLFGDRLSSDDLVPKNLLMIFKDASTQAYPELNYYYRDQTSFFVSGQTLSTGDGYRVLAPGADLGQTVESLVYGMRHHKHRGPHAVAHRDLIGNGYGAGGLGPPSGSNLGWDRPQQRSVVVGNDHPQYLMRNGWSQGSDPDNLDNAMLGPLVFGYDAGGYDHSTNVAETSFPGAANAPTHRVYFGQTDAGAQIGIDTGYGGTSAFVTKNYSGGFLEVDNTEGAAFISNGDTNSIRSLENKQVLSADGDQYSYLDVAGSNILHVSVSNNHNRYDLRGYSLKTTIGSATNCSLIFQASGATATMTECINGELKSFIDINNVIVDGAAYFGAEIYNTARTLDNNFTELAYNGFGKFKYISADKFVVDMEAKFYEGVITPDQWSTVATDDGNSVTGAAPLYYYRDGANGSDRVYATSPQGAAMWTLLKLPSDAHLVDFNFHVNSGTMTYEVFECPPVATAYKRAGSDTNAGGDKLTVPYTWTLSTEAGRIGNRYDSYGGTSYDVMVRMSNADAVTGMTAALCRYTYKLMRF